MKLKQITLHNFGPFAFPATLEVEPTITVITGRNDTGKSAVLRAIHLLYSKSPLSEDDVNIGWMHESSLPWKQDRNIYIEATFVVSDSLIEYVSSGERSPGEFTARFEMAPEVKNLYATMISGGSGKQLGSFDVRRMPEVIILPSSHTIGDIISETQMNPLEQGFMKLAFGENNISKLKSQSSVHLARSIRLANKKINKLLEQLLPSSLGISLVIEKVQDKPLGFSISIVDKYDGETPLHLRGSGIRKIITLLVLLLNNDIGINPAIVLFDEPENGLHADAQHMLRLVLEQITMKGHVQVIYATHSPSMINSVYANRIRLLERASKDGKATTLIYNQPIANRMSLIRGSLGINPADSLLYAPVTIVVEGPTEVLSIPIILKRLADQKVEGFEDIETYFPLMHFIDGDGSSYEQWCHLAASQGCKPILFVDGDQLRRVNQQKFQERNPGVSVVALPMETEFEEIVPKEVYFQSLREDTTAEVNVEDFDTWLSTTQLPLKIMFSKKVERWLQEKFPDTYYDKPQVMRRAVEIMNLEMLVLDPFLQLANKIKHALD